MKNLKWKYDEEADVHTIVFQGERLAVIFHDTKDEKEYFSAVFRFGILNEKGSFQSLSDARKWCLTKIKELGEELSKIDVDWDGVSVTTN